MAEHDREQKDLGTIKYLFESGLSEHPVIKRLLNTALMTRDTSELNYYLSKNQRLLAAVARNILLQEQLTIQNPFYPFPTPEEVERLQGTIKLGIVNRINGTNLFYKIPLDSLTMHTMVAGRSGTGKSWMLASWLENLVTPEMGFNVVLPDTKLFYRRLIGRVPGLNVITFDKLRFNFLGRPDWMHPRDLIFFFLIFLPLTISWDLQA